MPAINQDIEFWRGNTLTIRIGPLLTNLGTRYDLSSAEAQFWVSKAKNSRDPDIYIKKTTSPPNGMVINQTVDADYLVVDIVPDDTKDLEPKIYHLEAEIIDATTKIYTTTQGKFTLKDATIPPRS